MNPAALSGLNGKVVLVQSARDRHNPPTAMRGTIRISNDPRGQPPAVQIELVFPQMFTTRAHQRIVTLNDDEVAELIASDTAGACAVTIEDWLDPESPTSAS